MSKTHIGQRGADHRLHQLRLVADAQGLQYTYGSGIQSDKIQTVTYRKSLDAGSTWTIIKRFSYTYCGTGDANGAVNDLKTATEQNPNGSGWDTVAISYYRYYATSSSTGNPHCLKMKFGPEAYRQVLNAGITIDSATDATIKPYADNYFEYDPATNAVTKEIAAVCSTCPG